MLIPLFALGALSGAERINHAGRILGPVIPVNTVTEFNTVAGDAVMASLQIMPRDNPWNENISQLPVLANSSDIITTINTELAENRRGLRIFYEMNYILVPAAQPNQDMHLVDYPDESDAIKAGTTNIASYPFPNTLPIEGYPRETGSLTLDQSQRDTSGDGGDRHSIVLQPSSELFWETWQAYRRPANSPVWESSNCAQWNITSNALRTDGWTSADAAGLPMLPALIRYDEIQRGEIEHALRIIVKHTRRAYLYPASHHASSPSTTNPNVPAMGERLRLKSSFVVPNGWSNESKIVAAALKRYGGLVADNGGFLSISACPDPRFPDECFDDLRAITAFDFEVVQGTGPNAGPRSPGAPTVNAGADTTGTVAGGCDLSATATGSGYTVLWKAAPQITQPGNLGFAPNNALVTHVTFSATGTYTLLVALDDGVHVPAYDAVQVVVSAGAAVVPHIDQGHVRIDGHVDSDTVSVLVNGSPATLSGTAFYATVADNVGDVTVTAIDGSGNSSSRTLAVVATVPGGG